MQSFNIFEELLVMKKKKIVFALGDKIDDFAHELIKRVFGISEAWMSNESTMDDFDDLEDIPGHSLVRLSDVPVADRHLYKKDFAESSNPKKYSVWYPPVSDSEWIRIRKLSRKHLFEKVENEYNVSLEDFPKNSPLYVWKVAEFVKRKLRDS